MPEFPITLAPTAEGLAVHTTGCDCPNLAPGPGVGRYAAPSIRAAVALYNRAAAAHRRTPVPTGAPVDRQPCAANIPLDDVPPLPWRTRHQLYINHAARELIKAAQDAHAAERLSRKELTAGETTSSGAVPHWTPNPLHVKQLVKRAYVAQMLGRLLAGLPANPPGQPDDATCQRIVQQAEALLSEANAAVMDTTTQYADSMDRAYADAERQAAGHVAWKLRNVLCDVHAHLTTRHAAD